MKSLERPSRNSQMAFTTNALTSALDRPLTQISTISSVNKMRAIASRKSS